MFKFYFIFLGIGTYDLVATRNFTNLLHILSKRIFNNIIECVRLNTLRTHSLTSDFLFSLCRLALPHPCSHRTLYNVHMLFFYKEVILHTAKFSFSNQ